MLTYHIQPTKKIHGEITVPGDKSISHRALMLSAIAEGRSEIYGLLMGADNLATLHALQQLGVEIKVQKKQIITEGVGLHGLEASKQALDCGNSGTAMRLFAGLLAGQNFDSELIGDESLSKRPMQRIIDPLTKMGAKISANEGGKPPLHITGKQALNSIEYRLPVASAQVKSCLLLAGLYAQGVTTIIEPVPTRDHTERMLQSFHYSLQINQGRVAIQGSKKLQATQIQVPGDISSAAFFMVAASIIPNSQLLIKNVGINPTRDGILKLLKLMGADIQLINQKFMGTEPVADILIHTAELHGIEVPSNYIASAIDEFPILFIAAACAKGKTILRGAEELRVKETDRIAVMAEGLQRLGIPTEVLPDGLIVEGGRLQGGEIDSYGDHRIAMAFAIAGAVAKEEVIVQDCKNVDTSFPEFLKLARQTGMNLEER